MIAYEKMLDSNLRHALREGSMHFEKESAVHHTLERIAHRLDELEIPYAVAGGMALFIHGFRRFTEDVDILVNRDGLQQIHRQLEGLGWVAPFSGSKNLRDAENGVRIEFLITGDYPGDGKPKPVAFPEPVSSHVIAEGIRVLTLAKLIELKLASGMTNPLRLQDIVDVQRLIQELSLTKQMGEELNPFVRSKYHELWTLVQDHSPKE
jgi:hypothetical protein